MSSNENEKTLVVLPDEKTLMDIANIACCPVDIARAILLNVPFQLWVTKKIHDAQIAGMEDMHKALMKAFDRATQQPVKQ